MSERAAEASTCSPEGSGRATLPLTVSDEHIERLAEAKAYATWCDAAAEALTRKDRFSPLLARRVLKTVGNYLDAVADGRVFPNE